MADKNAEFLVVLHHLKGGVVDRSSKIVVTREQLLGDYVEMHLLRADSDEPLLGDGRPAPRSIVHQIVPLD